MFAECLTDLENLELPRTAQHPQTSSVPKQELYGPEICSVSTFYLRILIHPGI